MLRIILFIILSLSFIAPAWSDTYNQERIIYFGSNIQINQDASIDITETIKVYANDIQIRHGIVRRLPTKYKDSYGISRNTRYKVLQILIDGKKTPYHTKQANNQYAIYIGNKDTLLTPGIYSYTIKYHINKAINFLGDGDELYWNITGNNWDFPIMRAQANIQLPEGANILHFAGYTGRKGEQGQYFAVTAVDNQLSFTTTQALSPGEGLTIAVAWPKGFVQKPSFWSELKAQFSENSADYIILEIAALLLIYFLLMWHWYGRDPRKGTIIPLFEPPLNLSPAAVRYIDRMGTDMKTFTTAIVSMATKGFLTIKNQSDDFTIIRKDGNLSVLSDEESAAAKILLPGQSASLPIKQEFRETIDDAKNKLRASLKENYNGKYFITNTGHFLLGAAFSLLAFIAAIFSADDTSEAFFAIVWLSVWTIVVGVLLAQAWLSITLAYHYSSMKNIGRAIFSTLFVIPFLVGECVGIFAFSNSVPVFTMPLLFLIITINIVFYILLKAPTVEGRKIMDQIDGFKLFLSTTERYRINQLNPPNKTPELFEKYLPYAIALNVESEWGNQFNDVLKAAGIDPNHYHPSWYVGSAAFTTAAIGSFGSNLSSSLSSALSSASVSSSSSASGGGGSSGGGGGGGGGGGW